MPNYLISPKDSMKTFNDLEFIGHPSYSYDSKIKATQACMDFPNNYGVSVINSPGCYGWEQGLYEVAVLYKDNITYSTDITDDVLGFLSAEEVTKVMKQVQELVE